MQAGIIDLALICILLYLLWWLLMSKPAKFPPGPTRWPIVGNVYHLRKWGPYLYKSMAEMKRRYGDVAGFFVGSKPIVLISGLDAIKEASFRDDLSGRPTLIQHIVDNGKFGVGFTEGEIWKEQRRFTLRHLRDLGFGKTSMEGMSIEEVESIFEGLDKLCDVKNTNNKWSDPVSIHDILGTATINILCHILFGERYSFSDPYVNELLRCVKKLIAGSDIGGKIEQAFPTLAMRCPKLTGLDKQLQLRSRLRAFFQDQVKRHKDSLDENYSRDFIDTYLNELNKRKDEPDHSFSEMQLAHIISDLFIAGYETTFNTITFALLDMILYPEVQRKVQEELDAVVGKDKLPSFRDKDRLPYTEATIQEIYRFQPAVPMSVPHAPLMKDTEFRGYVIPKDSQILLNLYFLHHDPEIWGDPENFRPERFLDANGKVIRSEALLQFGTGKRACIGESLARNNVYLFFVCLMHKYRMRVTEGEPPPQNEPVGNGAIVSQPFKVQMQVRH